MQKGEARVVPLDAAVRRQILELAREHDQKLKSLEQDLFRAETKLKVESRWRWVDRLVCLAMGGGLMIWAASAGFADWASAEAGKGFARFSTFLSTRIDISGVPVPLNALLFAGAAVLVALVIGAILSMKPSPERAARALMKRVDKDPAVSGFIFRDGTFPQSSYDELRQEAGENEFDFPEPTLELLMRSILHPAAPQPRRTLQ